MAPQRALGVSPFSCLGAVTVLLVAAPLGCFQKPSVHGSGLERQTDDNCLPAYRCDKSLQGSTPGFGKCVDVSSLPTDAGTPDTARTDVGASEVSPPADGAADSPSDTSRADGRSPDLPLLSPDSGDVPLSGGDGALATGGNAGTGGSGGSGGSGGAIDSGGAAVGGASGSGGSVASGGAVSTGGAAGTGGAGAGGSAALCQESATKCSGNTLQTCTAGQWDAGLACGSHQTCSGPTGSAKCTCNQDPVCSSTASVCKATSTLATCTRDSNGCFYESGTTSCPSGVCSDGACCTDAVGTTCLSGTSAKTCTAVANACPSCTTSTCSICSDSAGSAACCTNACTQGPACYSSTQLGTCAVAANGCTAVSPATSCSTGQVCERSGVPACADPSWNQWPLPNSQVDVTAGAPNLEAYTDNGDGTVTDDVTSLMWQKTVATLSYTWTNAVDYCSTLTVAGHDDWRLPSLIEIFSIADPGQINPSINGTYFPSTPVSCYWSSTLVAGLSSRAWYVNFYISAPISNSVSSYCNVRCVR